MSESFILIVSFLQLVSLQATALFAHAKNRACLTSHYHTEWLMEAQWHLCLLFLTHLWHDTLARHRREVKRWEFGGRHFSWPLINIYSEPLSHIVTFQSTLEPWRNSETQLIVLPILYNDTLMYFDREEKSVERIHNKEAASPLCCLARSKPFTEFSCQRQDCWSLAKKYK